VEYLAQAAAFGDVLIIGLNSDSSIKRINGDNRPIMDEIPVQFSCIPIVR
jgi:D-beta-D-heptose 7-phosphate kinase/D-beta-D-heptose 1-phosphate adenosyltransferase